MNDSKLNELGLADLKKLYYAGFISLETIVYALPLRTLFTEFPRIDGERVSTCLQNLRNAGLLSTELYSPGLLFQSAIEPLSKT